MRLERAVQTLTSPDQIVVAEAAARHEYARGVLIDGRRFAGRQVRAIRRKVLDPARISKYLGAHAVKKLQIGTGPNLLPGWLNTDLLPDTYPEHRDKIVFLDAAKPFPFDDMTFDYVFSEHQVEHISEEEARAMIRECFRILRPSGRVRIATPDLAAIVRIYDDPLSETEQRYVRWVMERFWPEIQFGNPRCYVINHIFKHHRHQFIYDYETLHALLIDAGFVDVTRRQPGESDDPALCGVEAHARAIGEDMNRFETVVVEAVRPSRG